MKILFLIPYPLKESPSQRFRFEQYFETLSETNHSYQIQSFLSTSNWRAMHKPGRLLIKIRLLITGFFKRCLTLTRLSSFDYVFIHREVAPVGPPVFEWLIAKVFRKRIIYDFDDAIWLTDKVTEGFFEKALRWRSKVGSICRWSYKVSCGNDYLCAYARTFNSHVVLNPTTIDTEHLHKPTQKKEFTDRITIGWTGSYSTLKYLTTVQPVLQMLEKKYPRVKVLVVADQKPDLDLQSLVFLPWNKETEAADLTKIDIGIMPLPDDEWAKGKCGFKALQYMALEIPAVVSPVGVNTQIITQNQDGFLCSTQAEWITAMEKLISDNKLREVMGANGRKKIIERFSVLSNRDNFIGLFT